MPARLAGTRDRPWAPTEMKLIARALAVACIVAISTGPVLAEDAPARTSQIYQQRTADGRTVLSDRPLTGVPVQRSWSMEREDPVAAKARGEKVRLDAQAVSERIQRQLDSDRERAELQEAARLRVALAEARRDAELARQAARETPVYLPPGWVPRGPQVRPVRPLPQPRPVKPTPGTPWPPIGG